MNFQTIEQANGNSVMMFGVFTEIGGISYTQNQKAKSVCKITDDMGVMHSVHIYQGKGQLPGPQQAGLRYQFNLSTYQGSYQSKAYVGYSGFWNSQAQVAPPQNAPQATPQVARSATTPKDVDWDAKDLRMARMNALTNSTKLVCLMLEAGETKPPDVALIAKTAELIVNYIYNGLQKDAVKQASDAAKPSPAMGGEFDMPDFLNEEYHGG